MNITANVPVGGLVRYLDFNYGTSNNTANHEYYTTSTNSNGAPLIANTLYSITVNELDAGNLYWSVTARNDTVGITSNASSVVAWPGANVSSANTANSCNTSSVGTLVTTDPFTGNIVGGTIIINSGTGTLAANTIIANVVSNTQFNLNIAPTVALANACISINTGGITGNNIQNHTITNNSIAYNTLQLNNFSSNLSISQSIGTSDCQIMSGTANTYTAPVNVTTRTNYSGTGADPFFIIGIDPGSNYYYPVFQGTATTANGYLANSTGVFQPGAAAQTLRTNGQWNWYTILDVSWPIGTVEIGEYITAKIDATFVSNVNATMQISYGIILDAYPNSVLSDDNFVTTIPLSANQPYAYTSSRVLGGLNTVIGGAWVIRNITNSANIICSLASVGFDKGYGGII